MPDSDHDLLIRLSQKMIELSDNVNRLAQLQAETMRLVNTHVSEPSPHLATGIMLGNHTHELENLRVTITRLEDQVEEQRANWRVLISALWFVGPVFAAVVTQVVRGIFTGGIGV